MYLTENQHLPDFAALPINVQLLLYFLCRKVGTVPVSEPNRKWKRYTRYIHEHSLVSTHCGSSTEDIFTSIHLHLYSKAS